MDTVKALRRAGKRTFFVTNNSSKSRRQYCVKLEGFGVHGVGVEDIVTSGSAIAGERAAWVDLRTVAGGVADNQCLCWLGPKIFFVA